MVLGNGGGFPVGIQIFRLFILISSGIKIGRRVLKVNDEDKNWHFV